MLAKKFDLGMYHLGNGTTVCNRAVKEHGNYKYIAHISAAGNIKFYVPEDYIPPVTLANRTKSEKIIIERVIAIITNRNREGDAKVLNTNGDYNYISYYGTDLDYTTGTIMVTYLMYNPKTDYEDDIIERYDFVLDRNFED